MIDEHYSQHRLVSIYDANNPWDADTNFYLSLAKQPGLNILDLGCGTGTLCHGFAQNGHIVTGVDPASTMLKVAQQKPTKHKIQWVEATAQSYHSDQRFDLIVMSGHAFQVLPTQHCVMSALQTMRQHLKPQGIIAFESRNPAIDWAGEWDAAPDSTLTHTSGAVRQSIKVIDVKQGSICFEQSVQFADEILHSISTLRFMSANEIEECLRLAGFNRCELYGDWDRSEFDALTSREMIFVAQLAK